MPLKKIRITLRSYDSNISFTLKNVYFTDTILMLKNKIFQQHLDFQILRHWPPPREPGVDHPVLANDSMIWQCGIQNDTHLFLELSWPTTLPNHDQKYVFLKWSHAVHPIEFDPTHETPASLAMKIQKKLSLPLTPEL